MMQSSHVFLKTKAEVRGMCAVKGHRWVLGKTKPGEPVQMYDQDEVRCGNCGRPRDPSEAVGDESGKAAQNAKLSSRRKAAVVRRQAQRR